MALDQLTNANLAAHGNGRLLRLVPIKLFYLFTGRNAWWTTWVKKYRNDCMHPDLKSAKASAERQRTQGSVFNIKELPALLFVFPNISLLVTEINVQNPMSGYSRRAVRKRPGDGSKFIDSPSDNYFAPNVMFEGVSLSFRYDSRFWRRPPPPTDHVIQLISRFDASHFELLGGAPLKLYVSRSRGPQYCLSWNQLPTKVRATAVRSLASAAIEEARQLHLYVMALRL